MKNKETRKLVRLVYNEGQQKFYESGTGNFLPLNSRAIGTPHTQDLEFIEEGKTPAQTLEEFATKISEGTEADAYTEECQELSGDFRSINDSPPRLLKIQLYKIVGGSEHER